MSDGAPIAVEVIAEAGGWDAIADAEAIVTRAVLAAVAAADSDTAEDGGDIAVMLTDDASIRVLNREWRAQDKPTNVLSFPAPEPMPGADEIHIGDIAIAYETLVREAELESKPAANHLAHLAVHGTLHLLGYDHIVPDEAEEMEDLERTVLANLGVPDPYAETVVAL